MTRSIKLALGTAALCSAAAVYAASHSYSSAGPNQGWEGSTFWTVYARSWNSQSVTVNDAARRDVSMDWDLRDVDGADYVAGGGWGDVGTPTNVTYKLFDWSTPRGAGTFGIYGWSCKPPAPNLDVEFYVVDAWFGGWAPPSSGNYRLYRKTSTPVQTNNGPYHIYESAQIDGQPTQCGTGRSFKQVWAIRTVNRSVPTGGGQATINFSVLKNRMDDYGYFVAKYNYLVVGAEGLRNSRGHIRIQASRS